MNLDHLSWALPDLMAMARRRWPWVVLPALALVAMFTAVLLRIPNIYRAESVIMLEPQSLPDDMVRNIVRSDSVSRLETIRQTILSRDNMETIIRKHGIFGDVGDESPLWMERKVRWFRDKIGFELISLERQVGAIHFRISYPDENPALSRDVTNNLADLFIDFDYQLRLETIQNTSAFFEQELARLETRMRDVQKRLAEFKSRHSNELPEQLAVNLSTLNRLQEQLKANGEAIDRMEAQKLELDRQLAASPRTLSALTPAVGGPGPHPAVAAHQQKLQEVESLRRTLAQLQSRYTDLHPDVAQARRQLTQAETDLAELARNLPQDEEADGEPLEGPLNPVWRELRTQATAAETELRIRKKERETLLHQMEIYSNRVANTPFREQEIESTRREYDSLLENYDRMKQNLTQARLSQNMEDKKRGEQFKIIEAATLPQSRYKPSRARVFLFGLVLSIGLGGGLALGREMLDQTVHDRRMLERLFTVPVLVGIPVYTPPAERLRRLYRRLGRLAGVGVAYTLLVVVGVWLAHRVSLPGFITEFLYRL